MKTKHAGLNLVEIAAKYSDNEKARTFLESLRWPNGPVCPHCNSSDVSRLNAPAKESSRSARAGLLKCRACRKQFTVTVGSIFEGSHVPLGKWVMAIFLLCSSKKAMSAHQLHRMLGITYKSAWFMAHRIRHGMNNGPVSEMLKGTVEMDETYVGGKPRPINNGGSNGKAGRPGPGSKKACVVSLVERDGSKRSMVMERVTTANLKAALVEHVEPQTVVVTDAYPAYKRIAPDFRHHSVNHSANEYVRRDGDVLVHSNTVESSFSLLKRGVYGTFHHVSKQHLPRYLAEFDFRWNHRGTTDGERTVIAIGGFAGKRLKYRDS